MSLAIELNRQSSLMFESSDSPSTDYVVCNVLDTPRAAYVVRDMATKDNSSSQIAMVTHKAHNGLAHSDPG